MKTKIVPNRPGMALRLSIGSCLAAAVVSISLPVSAQTVVTPTPLPIPEPVAVTTATPEAVAEASVVVSKSKTVPQLQADGAAAIAKRQAALSAESAKVSSMTKDCGANALIQAEIARTSASLNAVGVALASTTDVTAVRSFYRAIFTEHRVYALVIPKVSVVERCDAQLVRTEALTAEAARLQTLIDKAKADGVNTLVAQTAKDAALSTLAGVNPVPSQATVLNLVPDRGDQSLLAANTAALKAANVQLSATLQQQRTVNAQLDAVRAALRQDIKADNAQDKVNAKLAADARRAALAAERAARQAAAAAARQAARIASVPPVVAVPVTPAPTPVAVS